MNSMALCWSKVCEVSFVQVALLVRIANTNRRRLVTKGARFVITFVCLVKRICACEFVTSWWNVRLHHLFSVFCLPDLGNVPFAPDHGLMIHWLHILSAVTVSCRRYYKIVPAEPVIIIHFRLVCWWLIGHFAERILGVGLVSGGLPMLHSLKVVWGRWLQLWCVLRPVVAPSRILQSVKINK